MKSNGRSKMDLTGLDECIEVLHEYAGRELVEPPLDQKTAERAAALLEYFAEKTANNRLYHKRQNLKQKEFARLFKQMSSPDELKEVERRVNKELGDVTVEDLQEDSE